MPRGSAGDALGYTTKGGRNQKIPDLAPAETTPTVVSDYLSYGSYSGADIKVVVHIPRSQVVQKDLKRQVSNSQKDLEKAVDNRSALNSTATDADSIEERFNSDEEISFLNDTLINAENTYTDFLNGPTSMVLGEVQSFSWSIFREEAPVRTLGSVYPRAYTKGPRTIGGTMIFTIFHQHVLHELLESNFKHYSTGTTDYDKQQYSSMLIDQLPPLDISLVFANEYGAVSHMGIYGVHFSQEGGTFSIEDIFSESVVQYTALDLDPMKVVQTAVQTPQGLTNEWTKTASQLMAEEEDLYGHLKRRNPFI